MSLWGVTSGGEGSHVKRCEYAFFSLSSLLTTTLFSGHKDLMWDTTKEKQYR